jgi:hypothetical protein
VHAYQRILGRLVSLAALAVCGDAVAGLAETTNRPVDAVSIQAVPVYFLYQGGPLHEPSCAMRSDAAEAVGWQSWPRVLFTLHIRPDGSVLHILTLRQDTGAPLGKAVLDAVTLCAASVVFDNRSKDDTNYSMWLYVRPQKSGS